MRFGVNLLLYSDTVDASVRGRFEALRAMGFDGVEVPIFEPGRVEVDEIRQAAERAGLALTASGALPPGTNFYTTAGAARGAEAYLRDSVRAAAELGAPVICGPLFKAVGDFDDSVDLPEQRARTARAAGPLADAAAEAGVTLALEPLNRFETNLFNTVADSVAFCGAVGSSGLGLLLDTFHMHIEEKDSAAAIAAAGTAGVLSHFHASENDRGTAGSGQVHWDAVAPALAASGYDGWVVLESFSQSNQAIRKAVSCWRPFYESPEAFAAQGLAFVRSTFGR